MPAVKYFVFSRWFQRFRVVSLVAIAGAYAGCNWPARSPESVVDRAQHEFNPLDPSLASKVPLVLRIKVQEPGDGSKYLWPRASVLRVLKNTTRKEIGPNISFAHLSAGAGVPGEECTVYLVPYESKDSTLELFKLFEPANDDGSFVPGYTHVTAK